MGEKYFISNDTYDNAIRNNEKGVLKALLIGIIGSDPTFATTEYDEANSYIKKKSEQINGKAIDLSEPYSEQEGEYTKTQDNWDEEYYRMLLVWYRDNYAAERLANIKTVGKEVYKNKPTFGKSKQYNRNMAQKQATEKISNNTTAKKAPIVMTTGNDERNTRLPIVEWFKQKWKWVAFIVGFMAVGTAIFCLLSSK